MLYIMPAARMQQALCVICCLSDVCGTRYSRSFDTFIIEVSLFIQLLFLSIQNRCSRKYNQHGYKSFHSLYGSVDYLQHHIVFVCEGQFEVSGFSGRCEYHVVNECIVKGVRECRSVLDFEQIPFFSIFTCE